MPFSTRATLDTNITDQPLTPEFAFVLSMLYMISADGELKGQEVGFLLSVIGGQRDQTGTFRVGVNDSLVSRAIAYRSRVSVDAFLRKAGPVLSNDQKIRIVINMADCALSDGVLNDAEERMLAKFVKEFGVSKNWFAMIMELLRQKNDRSMFGPFGCGPESSGVASLPDLSAVTFGRLAGGANTDAPRRFEGFPTVARLRTA